ncbi:hypothetical protein J7K27_02960 [Candidatus Bathyarchaeota archaeon]|nr:hypothetical protein [Candidatus Bathyarchaeota archaeon]
MFYPELKGVALEAYNNTVKLLIDRAMKEQGLTRDQITVRELRPNDFGLDNWRVGTSAGSFRDIVSSTVIPDATYIGITGVYNALGASSNLSQIKITREGSVARYWMVDKITNFVNKTGYADDPVTISPNTTVTISVYARSASSIEDWGLIGVVVEKKGMTINP